MFLGLNRKIICEREAEFRILIKYEKPFSYQLYSSVGRAGGEGGGGGGTVCSYTTN
jgi:hypothetical protein